MRVGELGTGDANLPRNTAGADDHLVGVQPEAAFGLDRVRVGETCKAGVLVDGHSGLIDL